MSWNNNDREESKPSWLNKAQKRSVVRTVRGWEMPLDGTSYGGSPMGWLTQGATAYVPHTELLVAMPTDVTGGAAGSFVGPGVNLRGSTGAYGLGYGGTASNVGFEAERGRDVPNYAPYFTCPFNGDGCTSGGPQGSGVTHNGRSGTLMGSQNYAYITNKSGVSSLGLPYGVTAYIKVCVNDFNFTNSITITSGSYTGFSLFTGPQLTNTTLVPTTVYEEFFGPTATVAGNIGVIRFTPQQATAGGTNSALAIATREIVIGLTANDGSASSMTSGPYNMYGSTAGVRFTVKFDRPNPYG